MYNIKEAAARAGVTVEVLRAWERRYAIVQPARTASGYRQFDDDAVARIRTMRGLVASGWSPSAAAVAILAGEVPVASPAPVSATPGADPSDADAADLARQFVAGARALDPAAIERTLDDLFARGSFERVADRLLFPALTQLGSAWAAGDVSVAGEHLASAAVLRRLALALEAAGSAGGAAGTGSRVVIGLPPGGRHELGALAFAVAARRAGLSIAYLGPDLPVDDWVVAARSADAAVIGVVTARDRRPAGEVAAAIRAANPGIVVAFGGDASPDAPDVMRLEPGLSRAVSQLAAALPRPAIGRG